MQAIKHWYFERRKRLEQINFEAHFGKRADALQFSLSMGKDTEDAFQITFGIPFLFLVYLSIEFRPWKWWGKLLGKAYTRDIVRIHFGPEFISLALLADQFDWTKGQFNGLKYIKSWKEIFCGDFKLESLGMSGAYYKCDAVPHLGQPEGITDASWVVTRIGEQVVWKRWYMRIWSKFKPELRYSYRVKPNFKAAFPGKRGDDSLEFINVHDVNSAKEAINYFNKRLTEYQTRY
jgi:hypothetical protein